MNYEIVATPVRRAVGFGVGAAALRTGSILISRNAPTLAKIHPALGILATFSAQLFTVGAITSGAIATAYTTKAVMNTASEK